MPIGIYDRKGWKGNQTSFKKGDIPKSKGRRKYEFECKCGNKVRTSDKRKKYCSRKCAFENRPIGWGKGIWLSDGYKKTPHGRLHRMIWENINGKIPDGIEIHHINGDRLDNRIENLQSLSKSEHTKLHWKRGDIKGGGRKCLEA